MGGEEPGGFVLDPVDLGAGGEKDGKGKGWDEEEEAEGDQDGTALAVAGEGGPGMGEVRAAFGAAGGVGGFVEQIEMASSAERMVVEEFAFEAAAEEIKAQGS